MRTAIGRTLAVRAGALLLALGACGGEVPANRPPPSARPLGGSGLRTGTRLAPGQSSLSHARWGGSSSPQGDPDTVLSYSAPEAVALSGETAPGTGGQQLGFVEALSVNEFGNAVFAASYGPVFGAGAGVFGWRRDDDFLFPIALAGQRTDLGFLPGDVNDYQLVSLPVTNDRNDVAFTVQSLTGGSSSNAIFFTELGSDDQPPCDLEVVAAQGQDAPPDGGFFWDFAHASLNENKQVAFVAVYGSTPTPPAAQFSGSDGIFVWQDGHDSYDTVVRDGDPLPETGGGTLCSSTLPGGPWIDDVGDVVFQANCITGAPALSGSLFIQRHGETSLRMFLKIGSMAPGGGTIRAVVVASEAKPINNEELAFLLVVGGDPTTTQIYATKTLLDVDDILGGDVSSIDVCAKGGQPLPESPPLLLEPVTPPALDEDGVVTFTAIGTLSMPFMSGAPGVYRCHQLELRSVVLRGDPEPGLDECAAPATTFNFPVETSAAEHFVGFTDARAVFIVGTRWREP